MKSYFSLRTFTGLAIDLPCVNVLAMLSTTCKLLKKAQHALQAFQDSKSRAAYRPRPTIEAATSSSLSENSWQKTSDVCPRCESLLDLRGLFNSFKHTGRTLKQRKVYLKSPGAVYHDLKHQNEFLLNTVFDAKGNYMYHHDCIQSAFGVSSQRLASFQKVLPQQASRPFVELRKEDVHHYSDLVLPTACEEPASSWLQSQPSIKL